MAFEVEQTIPILRIFDVAKAREFYLDYLGCTVDWEHRFDDGMPLYLQVSRGTMCLHLTEHHGDATPGSAVLLQVRDVDALHAELQAKNYRFLNPSVEIAPWNAKLLTLLDPFGNRLRFNESLDDPDED
ncbi:VOC family protein [Roseateles amylovorans]|uniref:Bleomycin resistance protein n=1 Tax=Roseateles amylovorans TaxID=2978473 RepID=A0ABY6B639_9BURK|nr:VOC family protein [Roseateles amylovorans]UXH78695.1 VOC family protein [Roseateles amylovorans]